MNQNLLIVDDEIEILMWLEELFRYDFDKEIGVYTANSAIEALDLLNQIKFDVVLTDIRMPGMDGITLFQKVKENWPRCKTVFLTGYGSFDEMYQLFQHRDVRYILKSEEDEVIQKTVSQALYEVIAELEQEEVRQKQKIQLERANDWMKRECMDTILSGEATGMEYERCFKELGFPCSPGQKLLLVLLRIEAGEETSSGMRLERTQLLQELLEENLPPKVTEYIHIQKPDELLLMIKTVEDMQAASDLRTIVQGAMEYVQEIFRNTCQATFSAVIKDKPVAVAEVSEAAGRLRQIMIGYMGRGQEVILIEEMLEMKEETAEAPEVMGKIPLLKSYLELRKRKEYFDLLSACLEQIQQKSSHDRYALELYYGISVLLLQFINANHMNEKIAFGVALYKLTKVDEHKNWQEAVQYLFEVSDAIFAQLGNNESSLTDRALHRVIAYIDGHLSEDLPLSTLAKVGGFNASYLSRLFKQIYQTTVTDYIYKKRMHMAKEMLEQTEDKIQDISAKAGYISAHSFARAFRNCEGVSPAEYRELHRV